MLGGVRSAPAASTAPAAAGRIQGIDAARALAIVGMASVHFGPFQPDTSTVGGALYHLPHGKASILFVLLAGVGVSLLFAGRTPAQAWTRIGWRAVVFYPLGVALQALPTPVAVILQFYALYYLVAAAAAMLPTRVLVPLTALWTVAGPIAFAVAADPSLAGRGTAATLGDPATVVTDLLWNGFYPLVTWAPPLLVGVLVGRAALRETRTTLWLTAAGATTALAAYGGGALARAAVPPDRAAEPLLMTGGHTGSPLAVLGATGTAVAVLGLCLLLTRALPRTTWPLVAVGQLALTVYVGHLLVLAVAPDLLEARGSVGAAAGKLLGFTVVTGLLCTGWRVAWARGPLEWLLALPFRGRTGGHRTSEDRGWDQRAPQATPPTTAPRAVSSPMPGPLAPHPPPPRHSTSGPSSTPPPTPWSPSTPISSSPPGTPPPPS